MAQIIQKPAPRKRCVMYIRGATKGGKNSISQTLIGVTPEKALALAVAAVVKEFPDCLRR